MGFLKILNLILFAIFIAVWISPVKVEGARGYYRYPYRRYPYKLAKRTDLEDGDTEEKDDDKEEKDDDEEKTKTENASISPKLAALDSSTSIEREAAAADNDLEAGRGARGPSAISLFIKFPNFPPSFAKYLLKLVDFCNIKKNRKKKICVFLRKLCKKLKP